MTSIIDNFLYLFVLKRALNIKIDQRSIAANSDFLIPSSFQHDVVHIWYFKVKILYGQIISVRVIKGLHQVGEIWRLENLSL